MPAFDQPILILGGTREAANLAATLSDNGYDITTSLAGRTREPLPLKGKMRQGGFGGVAGLAQYLRDNNVALLIDMTHPFAVNISANARQAAAQTNTKLIAWQRPKWEQMEDDIWHHVDSIQQAIAVIPANAKVLLALGSQHIAPFAQRDDVHFLVRMVDAPAQPLLLPHHTLLLAKPGLLEEEFATLQSQAITHIVCRNSGGKASYTKIAAARLLSIPVILIEPTVQTAPTSSLEIITDEIFKALALLKN